MLDLPSGLTLYHSWYIKSDTFNANGSHFMVRPVAGNVSYALPTYPYTAYDRKRVYHRTKPVRRETPLPFVHQSLRQSEIIWSRPYGTQYDGENVYPTNVAVVVDPDQLFNFCPAISESEIRNLALDFANKLGEQVPTQVDIGNFTWELREIGELIPKLEGAITKDLSGLYLNNKFGWSPFVGDIQALMSVLDTVRRRIAFLKETYGKRTRIGVYRPHAHSATASPITIYPSWDGGHNNIVTVSLKSYRCDVRATGYLFHKLEHLDGIDGELRGIFGALGLNNPLGSVWESLPYSFIVDYFLKVGDRLKRLLAIPPFPGTWQIQDPTFSIKTTCKLGIRYQWDPPGVYGAELQSPLSHEVSLNATSFVRYNYFPLNWLDVSEPTPNQLVLMLALIGANQ